MKHQLGEFQAADGLTKYTTVANQILINFLNDNLLGTKGVEMTKLQRKVEKHLQSALNAKTIHMNNISAPLLECWADAYHAKMVGARSTGHFYKNQQFSLLDTED